MNREVKAKKVDEKPPEPISAPTGLDLHPQPPNARRISKKAGALGGAVLVLILLTLAYGGYKRSQQAKLADQSKTPKAVAPATAAGTEFTKAIPPGNALIARGGAPGELSPPEENNKPGAATGACGSDPKTNQLYRFDPLTGRPCDQSSSGCGMDSKSGQPFRFDPLTGRPCTLATAEPQVIRPTPSVAVQTQREPTPEERRAQESFQREQEAMTAPTSVRFANAAAAAVPALGGSAPNPQSDLAQVAALGEALANRNVGTSALPVGPASFSSAPSSSATEYESQNMQSRKDQFLQRSAKASGASDYLDSVRTAPISQYEIRAGWEIPAVLEQSLNSDLPGVIKALVTSNVYDTATGQYLLIPQGSRLIGEYDSHIAYGQDGAQVAWDRIIFPDASSVDLAGMEGLDSHGNAGLRDKVDRHYKRLFGFAALSSVFDAAFDISQRQNQSVLTYPSPLQTAGSSVGREMSETSATITRRNLNVQPTIKVPAGYKFTVRVNRDIVFDAPYKPLTEDPDLLQSKKNLQRRTGF